MFKQVKLNDAILRFYQRSQPIAFSNAETLYDDLVLLRDQILMYGDLSEAQTNYLNNFIEKFDDKLTSTTLEILGKWLNDGVLADIVRVAINEEVIGSRDGESSLNLRLIRDKQDSEVKINLLQEKDDQLTAQMGQSEEFDRYNRNADYPLFIPTPDGMNQTVHPSVKYFPTGWSGWKYWMAHTPYPASNDDYENPCISVSNDGINWQDPVGITNPIDQPTTQQLADGYHMSDTHLVKVGDVMECWYRYNKNGVIDQIMRKTSVDGVNWSPREVVMETSLAKMNLSPSVIHEDGKYKLWCVDQDLKLRYTESPTGKITTWTNWQRVPVTFDGSAYSLWHIDVFRDVSDSKLYLVANCLVGTSRWLFIGESEKGYSFSGLKEVLRANLDVPTNWDGKEIYRSSLVKVGDRFRLYYSARTRTTSDRWKVGVIEGYTPYTMQKIDLEKMGNDERLFVGNVRVKKGKRYYFNEGYNAYASEQELRLLSPNGKLATIIRMTNDGLQLHDASGDKLYQLTLATLKTDKYPNGGGLTGKELKLYNPGVSGVRLVLTEEGDVRIHHDTLDTRQNLRAGGIILESPSDIQGVAGAIRFNTITLKHQAHNGTKWFDLY